MSPVNISWSGNIPLNNLEINFDDSFFQLPDTLYLDRERIWKEVKKKDDTSYDGTILMVNSINYLNNKTPKKISLQPIKYSNFKTLQYSKKYQIEDYPSYQGAFAMIYLVMNQSRNLILTGKRTPIGSWGDNFWSCPGGLIEYPSNGNVDIFSILFSELYEEVKVDLKINNPSLEGILYSNYHYFTNLVISITISQKIDFTTIIKSNEEFHNKRLYWRKIDEMKQLEDDKLFGGLRFLKYRKDI